MYKEKKANEINNLEQCPTGSDVGPFGRAKKSVDAVCAGMIYAEAINKLVEMTVDIDDRWAYLKEHCETTKDFDAQLMKDIAEEKQSLDARWALTIALFGVDA